MRAKVSQATASRWLSGTSLPIAEHIVALSQALGLPTQEIYRQLDPKMPQQHGPDPVRDEQRQRLLYLFDQIDDIAIREQVVAVVGGIANIADRNKKLTETVPQNPNRE